MTLCNMAIEMGARVGMVAPDEKTFAYIKDRPQMLKGEDFDKAVEEWKNLPSDEDAVFDREVRFNAADIKPHVTWGTKPAQSVEVTGRIPSPSDFDNVDEQKMAVLLHVIREEKPERMIIFGNRKDKNMSVAARLFEYGEDAELLSGDVPQEKRLKILDRFREGKTRILVATDVAARGIHVDGISHVVNYDLPEQADDYVHRIGRTGRAGEHGISISFADEFGSFVLPQLEQYTKCEIKTVQPPQEWLELPEKTRELPPEERARMNRRHGGSGGGRPHRGGGRRGRR